MLEVLIEDLETHYRQMFTKDSSINITLLFCCKMMLCKKGNFQYSFFIVLTQRHKFLAQKLTKFHIFIISLRMTLFSKRPYLTTYMKLLSNSCIGRFSGKKKKKKMQDDCNSKVEFFVTLLSSFQSLTNFTKNPSI